MIDNVPTWFVVVIVALFVGVCIGVRFANSIKPYDEGQPRTPGADYSDHFVCGVHGCHNPADGIHTTRHIPMCDRCALEIDALDGN